MFKYYYLKEMVDVEDWVAEEIEYIKVFDKRTPIHSEQIMAYGIVATSKEIPFESLLKNGLVKCVIDEEEYLKGLVS